MLSKPTGKTRASDSNFSNSELERLEKLDPTRKLVGISSNPPKLALEFPTLPTRSWKSWKFQPRSWLELIRVHPNSRWNLMFFSLFLKIRTLSKNNGKQNYHFRIGVSTVLSSSDSFVHLFFHLYFQTNH